MPFIVPALPFIAKAAVGLGASFLGKKLAGGGSTPSASSPEGGLLQTQQDAIKQGMTTAGELTPIAKGFLTTAKEGFQQPTDYWSRILSGSRAAATSALAPQIQQIQESAQKAGDAAMWLSPRSGTTAAGREASIWDATNDISTILQKIRPEAARSLVDIASREGALGTSAYGAAGSFLGGAERGAGNALDYLQRRNQLEFERSKQIGSGIWDLVKRFGGGILNKIGGGGGGPTNYSGVTPDQTAWWGGGNAGPV